MLTDDEKLAEIAPPLCGIFQEKVAMSRRGEMEENFNGKHNVNKTKVSDHVKLTPYKRSSICKKFPRESCHVRAAGDMSEISINILMKNLTIALLFSSMLL